MSSPVYTSPVAPHALTHCTFILLCAIVRRIDARREEPNKTAGVGTLVGRYHMVGLVPSRYVGIPSQAQLLLQDFFCGSEEEESPRRGETKHNLCIDTAKLKGYDMLSGFLFISIESQS